MLAKGHSARALREFFDALGITRKDTDRAWKD